MNDNICTFFGHSNCPCTISDCLETILVNLIEEKSVNRFLVGDKGQFDLIVHSKLKQLKRRYPQIDYAVVLAYFPKATHSETNKDYDETLLPEGIESVPPRFAISWRNKWMLRQADIVITYITHSWGGAAQFADLAKRQHKQVINIADIMKGQA